MTYDVYTPEHTFSMTILWNITCRKITKIVATRCQILRLECPTAFKNSLTDLSPSRRAAHRVDSRSCSRCVSRRTRFFDGWPRSACARAVATNAWSCCRHSMAVHTDGCWCPTNCWKPLFQLSQMLSVRWCPASVALNTFHVLTGNSGAMRRRRRRVSLVYSCQDFVLDGRRLTRTLCRNTSQLPAERPRVDLLCGQFGTEDFRSVMPAGTSSGGRNAKPSSHRRIYHWATWAMSPPPFELRKNCCYQMSDFKAKMHQIRFRLGLCPRPHWLLVKLTALPQTP